MVGSVLMDRLRAENDFAELDPVFFSTSAAGEPAPEIDGLGDTGTLQDAHDLEALAKLPVLVTTQGGTTPRPSTEPCEPPAGTASGSTPPPRCAWTTTP